MTPSIKISTQQNAARVAGFMYLQLAILAFAVTFVIRPGISTGNDYGLISSRILDSETIFRIGIICDLLGGAGNAVLAIALYTLLRPINEALALLAAFWRLADAIILGYLVYHSMVVLQLLKDPTYCAEFTSDQLKGFVHLCFDAQGASFNVGIFFYSLGSTLFCYLLLKSRYIPKSLSLWGVVGSVLAGASVLTVTLFPYLNPVLIPTCFAPVALFELVAGIWLLFGPWYPTSVSSRN